MIVSAKALSVTKVGEDENGNLEITGKILDSKYGLYAVRIF